MKKKIISVSGDLAAGKSTIIEILTKKLGYEKYSNGEYFRNLAKKHNMDVTSFGEYVSRHPEIDFEIETAAKNYCKDKENIILDARLGWYAVPESFKVYLKIDIDEAVKRAFNDEKRKDSEKFETIEEHKEDLIKRFNSENKRYLELYNIDKTDMSNYDFVIDTTNKSIDEVANLIINEYYKWLK